MLLSLGTAVGFLGKALKRNPETGKTGIGTVLKGIGGIFKSKKKKQKEAAANAAALNLSMTGGVVKHVDSGAADYMAQLGHEGSHIKTVLSANDSANAGNGGNVIATLIPDVVQNTMKALEAEKEKRESAEPLLDLNKIVKFPTVTTGIDKSTKNLVLLIGGGILAVFGLKMILGRR